MHVMTKYLDTRAAAINALQDFALMEQAAELPTSAIEAELRGDLASPSTSRTDGMPRSNNPTAGVSRVCATLDKIDLLQLDDPQQRLDAIQMLLDELQGELFT